MINLTFKTADLQPLITHAKNSKTFSHNTNKPHLLLIYDESGIYLTSNGNIEDPVASIYKVYAKDYYSNNQIDQESAKQLFPNGYFIKTLPLIENLSDLLEDELAKTILLLQDNKPSKFLFNVDYEAFHQKNEASIRQNCEENVTRNANGDIVITKDDPWYHENHWEEHFEKLRKRKELPHHEDD